MFQNKVNDQKLELLRAVFRNMYLQEKCDYLDGECKMLAEHLISSQIDKAQHSETVLTLKKDLDNLRQLHEQKLEELAKTKEKIISMSLVVENTKSGVSSSLTQNRSMNEELAIKNDMIKCLQEELVHVRLDQAEKWATIRELNQIKNELEKEKEILITKKPETVSRLQEELIAAKLSETQSILEFDNIKKHLTQIKAELQQHQDVDHNQRNNGEKTEGNVKLSKKGVLWLSNSKNEKNEVSQNIQKLEEEKIYLLNGISELQTKIEIINKHVRLKEEERCKIQEKLDNARIKQQSIENVTLERQRQYAHLEKSGTEKVFGIRTSSNEKKQDIEELSNKLDKITVRRQSKMLQSLEVQEINIITTLEKQIEILEEKIDQLNSEIDRFQYPTYPVV